MVYGGGKEKSLGAALLLALMFGALGFHRFYLGQWGMGLFRILLTGAGLWVWSFPGMSPAISLVTVLVSMTVYLSDIGLIACDVAGVPLSHPRWTHR